MSVESTGYRPWRGQRRGALLRFLPMARGGLLLLVRRKLFWFLLALGLMNFVFHAGVVYLFTEVASQFNLESDELRKKLPPALSRMAFTGTGRAYQTFIFSQNIVLMLLLGFAGVVTVSNDFRHRALSFYLSKPIGKIHFFLGKLLPIAVLAAGLTLLPALALFAEYGAFTRSFDYWREHARVFWAILASGALVCIVTSTLILGIAAWFRRATPTLLAWSGVFVLLPIISNLVRRQVQRVVGYEKAWYCGLLNVWHDLRWISRALFGDEPDSDPDRYMNRLAWALAVLGLLVLLSLLAFWRRVRATEVVK